MNRQNDLRQLSNTFRESLKCLEIADNSDLKKDIIALCDYLENPTFRIAVFGPFNYGKSTLLNALLGKKTLPIDLIPTTGAAIYVKYGEILSTNIVLNDGTQIHETGTNILKKYAILDDQRCMRDDVQSVEVYCDHPLLKLGVEFLDLPGTNDREEQNQVVKDKLLTADLIIQVVDARKLMTLEEREHFRDWLLNRGINRVILVINFLNLLDTNEQKEVYNRLHFVAESFRSNLPANVSNLYRVDALPALRARLKGDNAAAQTTGLFMFESALQSIITTQKENVSFNSSRILKISQQLKNIANDKQQSITHQLVAEQEKKQKTQEIQQRAITILKQGFQRCLSEFESWLYLPKLLENYQTIIAEALKTETFKQACQPDLEKQILTYQNNIIEWVDKACEFFEKPPLNPLIISLPDIPNMPPLQSTKPSRKSMNGDNITTIGIPTGIGWLLGGLAGAVVLGGTSYLLNKATKNQEKEPFKNQFKDDLIYSEVAKKYLTELSETAFLTLRQYEQTIEKIMTLSQAKTSPESIKLSHQLQSLNELLSKLEEQNFEQEI